MQGIIVFASIMATLGLQILLESGRQLIAKVCSTTIYSFFIRENDELKSSAMLYSYLEFNLIFTFDFYSLDQTFEKICSSLASNNLDFLICDDTFDHA